MFYSGNSLLWCLQKLIRFLCLSYSRKYTYLSMPECVLCVYVQAVFIIFIADKFKQSVCIKSCVNLGNSIMIALKTFFISNPDFFSGTNVSRSVKYHLKLINTQIDQSSIKMLENMKKYVKQSTISVIWNIFIYWINNVIAPQKKVDVEK